MALIDGLKIYKASPVGGRTVPDLVLLVEDEIPSLSSLEDQDRLYEEQATLLADALGASLPGGTIDRLFAVLALRRASSLRVALEKAS